MSGLLAPDRPQRVDHCCEELQCPAGALVGRQGSPAVVHEVKQVGVERIGSQDPPLQRVRCLVCLSACVTGFRRGKELSAEQVAVGPCDILMDGLVPEVSKEPPLNDSEHLIT